jgi:hypothetical protein
MNLHRNGKIGVTLGIIGGILAAISVGLYLRDGMQSGTPHVKLFHLFVLCLWMVSPPVWFAVEPYLLRPFQDKEAVKKTQEVWAKIWVGVSAMLTAIAAACAKV